MTSRRSQCFLQEIVQNGSKHFYGPKSDAEFSHAVFHIRHSLYSGYFTGTEPAESPATLGEEAEELDPVGVVCCTVGCHYGGGAAHREADTVGGPRHVALERGVDVDFFGGEHEGVGFLCCG